MGRNSSILKRDAQIFFDHFNLIYEEIIHFVDLHGIEI